MLPTLALTAYWINGCTDDFAAQMLRRVSVDTAKPPWPNRPPSRGRRCSCTGVHQQLGVRCEAASSLSIAIRAVQPVLSYPATKLQNGLVILARGAQEPPVQLGSPPPPLSCYTPPPTHTLQDPALPQPFSTGCSELQCSCNTMYCSKLVASRHADCLNCPTVQ
jgi:hypothetical protein